MKYEITTWKWVGKHNDYTEFIQTQYCKEDELEWFYKQNIERNPEWSKPYNGEYQHEIWEITEVNDPISCLDILYTNEPI